MGKNKKIALVFLALFILSGIIYSSVTNPYGYFYNTSLFYSYDKNKENQFVFKKINDPKFIKTPSFHGYFSIQSFQAAFRILGESWIKEKPFKGNYHEIIKKIHEKRFDTKKPYVISGGNFPELYARNLGIFFNSVLDPRTALSNSDWEDREKIILSSLALQLTLMKKAGRAYTTYYKLIGNIFTGVNVYDEPSDSLFSIVYTLKSMIDPDFIENTFPGPKILKKQLGTITLGNYLLNKYRKSIEENINQYLLKIIDPKTGLIPENIYLSSARDQIKRRNSFYDNVIAFSTAKIALSLGLKVRCSFFTDGICDFNKWKKHIIESFWNSDKSIFNDEIRSGEYSGDAFIVLSTGFLDLKVKEDRIKLIGEIDFVRNHKLDNPLPLRYAIKDEPEKLHLAVKTCAVSYMGETSWSHWGMEYIKSLILLSKYRPEYLKEARLHLNVYKKKMETYGGYPELYDKNGVPYETWCYKSLLHTGWVVNFEQALMMAQMK